MKRRTRNTLLIIVLAFAAAAVVSWPSVVRFIAQRGLEQARQNGANISWNGLTTGPSSVGLESLTIWIPGPKVKGTLAIPISLELQSLSVDLKLGSLLALSPAVTYGTGLYGGTISGDARREGERPDSPRTWSVSTSAGTLNFRASVSKEEPPAAPSRRYASSLKE